MMDKKMMLKTRAEKQQEDMGKGCLIVILAIVALSVLLTIESENNPKTSDYYPSTEVHLNAEYNEYVERPCLRHYGVSRYALDRGIADSHRRAVIGSVRHLTEADRMKEYRSVLEQCKSLR